MKRVGKAGDLRRLAHHFRRAAWRESTDPVDPVNARVRDGGEHLAADGQPALVQRTGSAAGEVAGALAAEPADRVVRVPWTGVTLTLDDFLLTRLVEFIVHTDDLAASVGIPTPPADPVAHRAVLDLLLALSVERHGPTALLRALSRTERAPATVSAL